MTTTTENIDEPLCQICQRPRADHATMKHEYNTEGKLVEKKPPGAVRVQPAGTNAAQLTGMMMRLTHRLAQKGVFDDDDIRFITSGSNFGSPTGAEDSEVGVYPRRPKG